jgi:TolB-like protein
LHEENIAKIADVLRVQYILEGSVHKTGNHIRVTAQFIRAADGYRLRCGTVRIRSILDVPVSKA